MRRSSQRNPRSRGDAGGGARRDQPSVDLTELIDYLTRNLVEHPDEVEVTLVEERDADVYEIEVDDPDLPVIIGRGGRTAKAIRAVVGAVAPRSSRRTLVEILE